MELADLVPDPKQRRLLEWLTTPPREREPKEKQQLAAELGVDPRTLRRWEKGEAFRRAWEKVSQDVIGDPEKVAEVLEVMRLKALNSEDKAQVQAAKLYLEAVDAIKPPPVEVSVSRSDLKDLTDDSLDERIARLMAEMEAAEA